MHVVLNLFDVLKVHVFPHGHLVINVILARVPERSHLLAFIFQRQSYELGPVAGCIVFAKLDVYFAIRLPGVFAAIWHNVLRQLNCSLEYFDVVL